MLRSDTTTMGPRFRTLARGLVNTAAGAFAGTAGRVLEPGRLVPDDHRPWRFPAEPWVMAQTWEHLLFAHWPVAPASLRPLVPSGLELDVLDGSAWLAVTPFRVRHLRARGLPPVPGVSDFHEINVRTYVTVAARPGVFFFSLDANSALGVRAAQLWYGLPYRLATLTAHTGDGWRHFHGQRVDRGAPARVAIRYRPIGPVEPADRSSLVWWLTERYCLYATPAPGRLERAEIHHPPWPLQRAEARIQTNTMTEALGLRIDTDPALLHYSERLDVRVWRPHPVDAGSAGS